MVSNSVYSVITAMAAKFVPDEQHAMLHVNAYDAWVELVVNMVDRGLIKPKPAVLMKFARNWEELLTLKYSRLN